MTSDSYKRDTIFISKATPGDDDFALWLAPKLEAMEGVQEEIEIAKDLIKELGDPNFILPLKMRRFRKLFGVGGLQYIDFEHRWADGLAALQKSLEKQDVPKSSDGKIQPQWEQYLSRRQITVDESPETLTSNWLRLEQAPDTLYHLEPRNPCSEATVRTLGQSFKFPVAEFGRGFITFASPLDLEEHFLPVGPFEVKAEIPFSEFIADGFESSGIDPRDAKNMTMNLLRQAWEKHCKAEGFLHHKFSNASSFHVGESKIGISKRVSWGRQGARRNSMLRNISKGKVWEYGVSVIPSLFPYPHFKLLRRSVCSGWRNKAWHGRVMAFMELLAGESPYVAMPVGGGQHILADALPISFTSPVSTRQTNYLGEDAEEKDLSTVQGFMENDDVGDEAGAPPNISIGVIGTSRGLGFFKRWAETLRGPVKVPPPTEREKKIRLHLSDFPGLEETFGLRIDPDNFVQYEIEDRQIDRSLAVLNHHESVAKTVDLYMDKVIRHGRNEERSVDVWVFVVREDIFKHCRSQSRRAGMAFVQGEFSKKQSARTDVPLLPGMFDEKLEEVFDDVPDFHRQVKARLLKLGQTSQMVRETTLAPDQFVNRAGYPIRGTQDVASTAWNFATGLYGK